MPSNVINHENVHRQDEKFASIRILSSKRLVCAERGSVAYYSLFLTSKPKFDVKIEVIIDKSLVTIHPPVVVFTPNNYNVEQF